MTAYDDIMRELREFARYTGDGKPGAPVSAPLPVGDPQSGPWSPKKAHLRLALGNLAQELMDGVTYVEGAIPAVNAARDFAIAAIAADRASALIAVADLVEESEEARDVTLAARDVTLSARDVGVDARNQSVAAAEASGPVVFYDTKALANAALSGLPDDQIVEIFIDESQSSSRARYRKEGVDLVLKTIFPPFDARVYVVPLATGNATIDTVRVQALVDAAPAGSSILFTKSATSYFLGQILISKSLFLDLRGAKVKANGQRIFALTQALDFLEVRNAGGVDVNVSSGPHTVEFFSNWSLTAQSDYNNAASGTKYSIGHLVISDNVLDRAKLTVVGDTTVEFIERNIWRYNTDGAFPLPYSLMVAKGANAPDRKDGGRIRDNIFDVYCPTTVDADGVYYHRNYDIVKLTRAFSYGVCSGNLFRNNNPGCPCAQVDLFTGAHGLNLSENTFRNVQLHRKQQVGAVPTPDFSFDAYVNNIFVVESGFKVQYITASTGINNPIYIHGSLFTLTGNRIVNEADTPMSAIYFPQFDAQYDAFASEGTSHAIIALNTADLRSDVTTQTSSFLHHASPSTGSADEYLLVMGNMVVGGDRFYRSTAAANRPKNVVDVGNIWTGGYAGAARAVELDILEPIASVANLREGGTQFSGALHGEKRRGAYVSLASASTVDVSGVDEIRVDGAGTLSSLTGGAIGQTVILRKLNSNGTVSYGTATDQFILAGKQSWMMTADAVLVLQLNLAGVWQEVARSDTRRQSGTTAQRPSPGAAEAGVTYFDTTLGRLINWTGSAWVTAGTNVAA